MEKKKTVNIVLIIILALIAVGLIVFIMIIKPDFLFPDAEKNNIDNNLSSKLLKAEDKDDIKSIIKECGLAEEQNGNVIQITGIKQNNEDVHMAIELDNNDIVVNATQYRVIAESSKADNYPVKDLIRITKDRIREFLEQFGISNADYYEIISDEQVYNNQDEESFKRIIDGTAQLRLTVRDGEHSYWILKAERTYGADLMLWIDHYMYNSYYENMPANYELAAETEVR